jgi:hypothetical protein
MNYYELCKLLEYYREWKNYRMASVVTLLIIRKYVKPVQCGV